MKTKEKKVKIKKEKKEVCENLPDDPILDLFPPRTISKEIMVNDPVIKKVIDEIMFGEKFHLVTREDWIQYIRECENKSQFVINCHFCLGIAIRNHFDLWQQSEAVKFFNEHKIYHADDMSYCILDIVYDLFLEYLKEHNI